MVRKKGPRIGRLHRFVRWVAFENARHNIRCNVLMLGMIDTPMATRATIKLGTPVIV
jgi:NAD(P)-dependent dehydrogenase (short-subunit alcohol dehydrogenase family)